MDFSIYSRIKWKRTDRNVANNKHVCTCTCLFCDTGFLQFSQRPHLQHSFRTPAWVSQEAGASVIISGDYILKSTRPLSRAVCIFCQLKLLESYVNYETARLAVVDDMFHCTLLVVGWLSWLTHLMWALFRTMWNILIKSLLNAGKCLF